MQQLTRVHDVRFKIAGRLHDDIGADLGAILLKSESIRSAATLDDTIRQDLADIGRVAREAAESLQETVWMISAKYDTVARLVTKLRDTTDTLLHGAVTYSVTVPPNPPDQPIEMEARQSAYLLFKEALHNVVKHARAKHVNIAVYYEAPRLSISIEDDGRGFDPERADAGNGIGLMRERAARHGGSYRLTSVPGRGTTVEFSLRLR